MEPIFENSYCYTMQNLTEMQKRTIKFSYKLSAVFFAFMLLEGVYFICSGTASLRTIVVSFLLLVGLISILYLPRSMAKQILQRNLVLYNTQPHMVVNFFEDRLEQQNETSNSLVHFAYEEIVEIKETKNLYLFCFPKMLVVIVEKQGFVIGQTEEFLLFLKQKCPRAARKL